jgi:hypothetical protein
MGYLNNMEEENYFQEGRVMTQAEYYDKMLGLKQLAVDKAFHKNLSRLRKLLDRKVKCSEETLHFKDEFEEQLNHAFIVSKLPQSAYQAFYKAYGDMLLGVGFVFAWTAKDNHKVEEKQFKGFSLIRALKYLYGNADLEQIYADTYYALQGLKKYSAGSVELVSDNYVENVSELQGIEWVDKLNKIVAQAARYIACLITPKELESMCGISGGRITSYAYVYIQGRVCAMLKEKVQEDMRGLLGQDLFAPTCEIEEFYLPKKHKHGRADRYEIRGRTAKGKLADIEAKPALLSAIQGTQSSTAWIDAEEERKLRNERR